MIQRIPFLSPAWTSGISWFMYCWSLAWRILSNTLLTCEMNAIVQWFEHSLTLSFFEIRMSFPNLLAYWVQHFNRIRTLRNSGCEKLRILAQIAEMQMRRVISVSPDGSIFPYIKKCQIPKLGISDFLWKWKVKVVQLCPALCDPMYYTTHGILQARILECVAFPFSRGSSQPRDQTQVSCIAGRPLPAELQLTVIFWYSGYLPLF